MFYIIKLFTGFVRKRQKNVLVVINLRNSCHGCYVNGECFNHVVYADDTLLLAPSPTALQNLTDILLSLFYIPQISY